MLSDPEHNTAEDYGLWGEKKMYGNTFMGMVRSFYLIDENGDIENTWNKITPENTVTELMEVRGSYDRLRRHQE